MIDPAFRNINRLFVLSFNNGDNDPARGLSNKYYRLLVETEYSNALIDNKIFFGLNWKEQTRRVWRTCWNVDK